jgi:hypothetical protein
MKENREKLLKLIAEAAAKVERDKLVHKFPIKSIQNYE